MRIKKDLKEFIENNLDSIIEDHFDMWKDRYYRLTATDVYNDLVSNYDFSGELESVEYNLNRKLSLNEQAYYIGLFQKTAYYLFHKRG